MLGRALCVLRFLTVVALSCGCRTQAPAAMPAPSALAASPPSTGAQDRVYIAEQFSNTVSVVSPSTNTLLGQIRLGDTQPSNLSPLYRGQLLVHGLGFSPDHRTVVVVSIGSNSVTFIDTATNAVRHVTYVGRSPHEAFFTTDGKEVWVTVRGEDYVSVLDSETFTERRRIPVGNGPGMTIFSPDGRYGYVCSSFTPETVVVSTASHEIVGRIKQDSPFCPNIAVTPEGDQVWFTLKDIGAVQVFDGRPPFARLRTIESGPITNHVNIVRNERGRFAYVTVGGLNEVQVYRTDTFQRAATIPVGDLPHGLWASGDGARVYVGLENADRALAIDTRSNSVVASIPIGQASQALVYVPNAVPVGGDGRQNLEPLGLAGSAIHMTLVDSKGRASTTVALFDQGVTQVLQAAVTGLLPRQPYALALAGPGGAGPPEVLARFTANAAGAAIVNAVGPIRQIAQSDAPVTRRVLVVAPIAGGEIVGPIQIQAEK